MNEMRTWMPRRDDEREIPFSELALHTGMAGKTIASYQIDRAGHYVYVIATDGTNTDGSPGEVLPFGLQHRHRIGAYSNHRPDRKCRHCAKEPWRLGD